MLIQPHQIKEIMQIRLTKSLKRSMILRIQTVLKTGGKEIIGKYQGVQNTWLWGAVDIAIHSATLPND